MGLGALPEVDIAEQMMHIASHSGKKAFY